VTVESWAEIVASSSYMSIVYTGWHPERLQERMHPPMSLLSRRSFLAAAAGLPFAAPLHALWVRSQAGLRVRGHLGYGPLAPVADATTGLALLELPAGFRYVTFGWSRDPMTTGAPTPSEHDGMASFAGPDGTIVLVRNHEISPAPAFSERATRDEYRTQPRGNAAKLCGRTNAVEFVAVL
jgi:secreted PhoX family phosphatase